MSKVESLKKITLKLEAGTSSENMDLSLDISEFEFIFGIGPAGISPFEYELVNKTEGQQVLVEVKKENFINFFEHLHPPIFHLINDRESLFLKVKIKKIAPVDHREAINALSEVTAHGHGCDCGCGC
jgi:hypothetical protein